MESPASRTQVYYEYLQSHYGAGRNTPTRDMSLSLRVVFSFCRRVGWGGNSLGSRVPIHEEETAVVTLVQKTAKRDWGGVAQVMRTRI